MPPTALLERVSCRGFAKASSLRKFAIFFYYSLSQSSQGSKASSSPYRFFSYF
jgi:hypothetical protein